MARLMLCPQSGEVFHVEEDTRRTTGLDGDVYVVQPATLETWQDVTRAEPPTSADWMQAPGLYGPGSAVARLSDGDDHGFTAGGNVVTIIAIAADRGLRIKWLGCYADRNDARAAAEVEW